MVFKLLSLIASIIIIIITSNKNRSDRNYLDKPYTGDTANGSISQNTKMTIEEFYNDNILLG